MQCDAEACTGVHDDRRWADLCPRTRESKRANERKAYSRLTGYELNMERLRLRRLKGLQRMKERGLRGTVSGEG